MLPQESRRVLITDFGGERCILTVYYDDGTHRDIPLPDCKTAVEVVEVIIDWLNKNLPIPIPLPDRREK